MPPTNLPASSTRSVLEISSPHSDELELEPQVRSTMKRVFLTGGAGFIGFHTARVLLERGDEVVIIDELNDYYDVEQKKANLQYLRDRFSSKKLSVYVADMADAALIQRIFTDHKPTHVVHLAARAGVRPSIDDPLLYIHSNVTATTVLLEAARLHGVQKFVYASSSSVYGGSKKEFFSESDAVDHPVSQYAASKKTCELLAHTYYHLYGLNCIGLRFFTVYGPRGRPDMAPFKFVHRVLNDIEIQQYGDGSTSRDYTYIDDIVQGVVLSLDKASGYEVYNLGNGTPMVLKDFIKTIELVCGKKAIIREIEEQPGDVPRTCADISKAKRELGYCPTTSVLEGMEKTVSWYKTYRGMN